MPRLLRILTLLTLLAAGCSETNSFPDGTTGGDGGGMDAAEGDGSSTRPDVVSYDTPDPILTPDSACARQTSPTQRLPMNLLIVLDRSGSMSDGMPVSKWTAAVNGITRLLRSLGDDTNVGLLYFPSRSNPSAEASYNAPVVAVAPLSTTRAMIDSALRGTSPTGNTPMACAMPGAVSYLNGLSGAAFEGSRIIILITDGAPTQECSGVTCTDIFDFNCLLNATRAAELRISTEVARAAALTPPIRTFVLGTPEASRSFLSTLAVNGNSRRTPGCEPSTSCHYSLSSATFETDLNAALDDIRGRAATCEFRITVDPGTVDPNLVNVTVTAADGSRRVIPRDVRRMNGWDYAPGMRAIVLYGPACDGVRMETLGGRIEILFGCPTVTPG